MATLDSIKGVRNPFWTEDAGEARKIAQAMPLGRVLGIVARWGNDALLMTIWTDWEERVVLAAMQQRYPHARVSVMEMSEQG